MLSRIARIKLLHIRRHFSTRYVFGELPARYLTLTAEQKRPLARLVEALANYLEAQGRSPADRDLLGLVCIASRLGGYSDPDRVLNTEQTDFTDQELEHAAFRLDVATRRLRDYAVLPPADRANLLRRAKELGIDLPLRPNGDPVKLLAAFSEFGQRDRPAADEEGLALPQQYRLLSVAEGRRLARDVLSLWKSDPAAFRVPADPISYRRNGQSTGMVDYILLNLACLVPGSLKGLHEELIEGGMCDHFVCHSVLYHDADAKARDHLMRLLVHPPHDDSILGPLAWIGDDVVQTTFHGWTNSPPEWASGIDSRMLEFVNRSAGWELTPAGGRRALYYPDCYRLVAPKNLPTEQLPGPVAVITPHERKCGWCERQLVSLFDIDLQDPRVSFLAPGWDRIRVAMCPQCTWCGTLYTDVDRHGGSTWSDLNTRPDYMGGDQYGWPYPYHCLVLGPRRRSPLEAHLFVASDGGSQLGGFPTWVAGITHPRCPKCHRWMVIVGQLQAEDALGGPSEGFTYAFLCQECRIAATTFEMT